ncbi:MAG: 2-dehydro-3-deoxyglucarate aldolase [Hyphomicrobiaceae bacterium]|nr:MAG: 2-dehydro-3-deoxyglucarate aldolase [Hyphomicrobiaceae bacterium]
MFPSPQIVEMIGAAGFDWVLLDCEHGSIGLESLEIMCMAAEAAGITPIARPRSSDPTEIAAVLDRGAAGVQVPHVNSAIDARRAVASVKFGPQSLRSLAVGTRPDRYGLAGSMTAYADKANAETLVAVQIEHAAALPNIEEMLAVAGIDVFFIGPSDLSQSMGFAGNPKAPPVAAAIKDALGKIREGGHIAGMPATAEALPQALASGALYIYTHLPRVIGAGAEMYLKSMSNEAKRS